MALTPMSKDSLLALKTKLDADTRTSNIKNIITTIYTNAVNSAKTSPSTKFQYNISTNLSIRQIRPIIPGNVSLDFYLTNMTDIINGLTPLFPGCKINHIVFGTGVDTILYDVTKVPSTVTLNTTIPNQDFIVIDWS